MNLRNEYYLVLEHLLPVRSCLIEEMPSLDLALSISIVSPSFRVDATVVEDCDIPDSQLPTRPFNIRFSSLLKENLKII